MAAKQQDRSSRTEKPTPRRLRKAYEQGNVPRSPDVGQAVSLAAFLLWAWAGAGAMLSGLARELRLSLAGAAGPISPERLLERAASSGRDALLLMAPLLLPLLVLSVVGQIAQSGFHPRKQPIPFELNRVNPVEGLKRFVTVEKLVAAGKALLRVALYAAVAALVIVPEWPRVVELAAGTPLQILQAAAAMSLRVLFRALILGAALAALDYAFTRYRWYRNLYMTKQEIRDEAKENEGDPLVRSRLRARQRDAARRRMIAGVRTADVVVTNPVHVAVALRYRQAVMNAPVVVAKGRGYIAQRIKEEARKHGVPIVEDPPLARALDRLCEVGLPIPEALYRAVAEVLAYVMGRRRGPYRTHPEVDPQREEATR
ncbi:MAG: EscU/YscU/HrcU family type III secretion system export apparatus switch protein [Acidobacteria bacterium]|nr:MAG: EscU/YscU/HrcU family type III secretion system export apparatus switch protein [Acidobacteriota bacterium]